MKSLRNLSSNQFGLILLPQRVQQLIPNISKSIEPSVLQRGIELITNSLASFGSTKSQQKILERAKKSNRKPPNLRPHNVHFKEAESIAYTSVRLIPSFAACSNVLLQLQKREPDFNPKSILDFGCGPGSALLAAKEIWTDKMDTIKIVDISQNMLDISRQLVDDEIEARRYLNTNANEKYDLVISSFTLSEIADKNIRKETIRSLWEITRDTLVLVDRGTPVGSEIIVNARDQIMKLAHEQGIESHIVAPCPHIQKCPMVGNKFNQWCHFSQKYQMTPEMRFLKKKQNPQSDVKFSFVVIRKTMKTETKSDLPGVRTKPWPTLILPPLKRKGHVVLNVCSPNGTLEKSVVLKSHSNEVYAHARKSKWGDLWPFEFLAKSTLFSNKN